jgi:putative tricarboxylic transport membrane protein
MSNWRGFVAAPGTTEEAKAEFIKIVTEMRDSVQWQGALKRNSWTDTFSTGEEFEQFVAAEVATAKEIVKDLGL